MDYTILVGGEAGQGMDTFARLLEKTLKRLGYYVYSHSDYMSRVRGGHNFIYLRFSDKKIYSYRPELDIVFALNEETIEIHQDKLGEGGIIIADKKLANGSRREEIIYLDLVDTAESLRNSRVYTTVGLGAILRYYNLPIDQGEKIIREEFNEKIYRVNLNALRAGYAMLEPSYDLKELKDDRILINGNQAVGLGAIAAGCKYYCGYPMTPSTGVLNYIASHADEMEIAIDQVEDEVAALNMALGASYAGVRAMTGSSGGGFALMVEALSLAGMIELPVVVINVQRPGPATGFPTRTEQSDLRFMVHAGHGEFPRMIMALRSPEDAFYQTARAFNIADKYQIPVLLLSDQYLADCMVTEEPFDFGKIEINRYISGEEALVDGEYKRYRLTGDGISPRILPGQIPGQVVLVDSDEHDEWGNITESAEIRVGMVEKRLKKVQGLKEEIQEPWLIGQENPENLIVAWGSTYGAVREAVERFDAEGHSIGALIFGDIWPLPTKKLLAAHKKAKQLINIEQNATGQLESLIREEALIKADKSILKYDGRPFSGQEVYDKLKEVL